MKNILPASYFTKSMEVCVIQNDDPDSSQIRNVGGDPCETQDQQDEKQRDKDRDLIPNTLDQSHGAVLGTTGVSENGNCLGVQIQWCVVVVQLVSLLLCWSYKEIMYVQCMLW